MKELLRQAGEKLGIIQSAEEKEQEIHKIIEHELARAQKIFRLSSDSDACFSEVEFILGFSDEDPHPQHKVSFRDSIHNEEDRDFYTRIIMRRRPDGLKRAIRPLSKAEKESDRVFEERFTLKTAQAPE